MCRQADDTGTLTSGYVVERVAEQPTETSTRLLRVEATRNAVAAQTTLAMLLPHKQPFAPQTTSSHTDSSRTSTHDPRHAPTETHTQTPSAEAMTRSQALADKAHHTFREGDVATAVALFENALEENAWNAWALLRHALAIHPSRQGQVCLQAVLKYLRPGTKILKTGVVSALPSCARCSFATP